MSQAIFTNIEPTTTTGLMLVALLDDWKDAIVSGFSGTARPPNLQAGGIWIDVSQQDTPNFYWSLKIYNGTSDIELLRMSLLTGTSGSSFADGDFTVRRISADTTGPILNLVKQRVDTNGQVLSGDTVYELKIIGRTDTSTDPVVAYLKVVAAENQTASAFGVNFSLYSTQAGTSTLAEYIKFATGQTEFLFPHKINSLIYGSDSVATTASMVLTTDKLFTELTGSTAANIHGIEVDATESKVKHINNRSSANLTFVHQSGTASSTERFSFPSSRNIILLPDTSASFYYCETDQRWKVLSTSTRTLSSNYTEVRGSYYEFVAPLTGRIRVTGYRDDDKSKGSSSITTNGTSEVGSNFILSWGSNAHGQQGNSSVTSASTPTIAANSLQFKYSKFDESSLGINTSDNAFAWGRNQHGQLGLGDVTPRSSPVAVLGGIKFTGVNIFEYAIGSDYLGKLYSWGRNQNGQLGLGDTTSRSSPVAVLGGLFFSQFYMGYGNTGGSPEGSIFAVERSTGSLYAWGANDSGRLGLGDNTPRSSPVAVLGSLKIQKVVLGNDCNVVINHSGAAYAWGINTSGQLGLGDVVSRSSPVAVLGGLAFKDLYALSIGTDVSFYGLTANGNLYAWGMNDFGQLGVGDVLPRSSPVAVLGGLTFKHLATGINSKSVVALTKDTGAAYAWGENTDGQLGLGDVVHRSSPVAVLGGLFFSDVFNTKSSFIAESKGLLYAWGLNSEGELGVGDTVKRSSPVLVLASLPISRALPKGFTSAVVNSGNTYKLILGSGDCFFADTKIGENLNRATIVYEE